MPELPPEPVIEPPPKSADKLDIMSRNCSELKKTLAVLQGQMNALTAEKVTQEAPVNETTQPKKSKNKKNKANKSCPIKERIVSGAKVVNTTEKETSNADSIHDGEVSNENNDIPASEDSVEENATAVETEIERVDESILPGTSDVSAVDQTTEENIKVLIDELVKDVQTNLSLESQKEIDAPMVVVEKTLINGGNNGVTSESVESKENNSPVLATKLNNDESALYPVNISSN